MKFSTLVLVLLFGSMSKHLQAQQKPVKNLSYFVEEAVKRSPLLKDNGNQLQANRIDSMRLKAGYLPQVTATSSTMYAPLINGYGYDKVLTNGQALEALINVNYNLIGKNNLNNQLKSIRLQSDSLQIASKLSVLDLKRAIGDQYITAFASQEQAEFNKEVYQLLNQEDKVLRKLTQANVYKQVDYLTFLVTFKQQQLQWKQAELQLKNDYSTLNYLTGIVDTSAHQLADPDLLSFGEKASLEANISFDEKTSLKEKTFLKGKISLEGKTSLEGGIPLEETKNQVGSHPVYGRVEPSIFDKKFDLDSTKLLNQKAAIGFLYQPKVGFYANSGFNSSLAFQPYRNFGASIGFTVSVPIYDGHQRKMLYDKLALEQLTASQYKAFFRSQHEQQLNVLKQQINDQNSLYQKINEQLKFSKGLIEVDSKLLQTGDIRVADFVIAINNYLAAQNLLRQTNISRLKLINQLNYWNQ